MHASVMYRRSVLESVGGFDPSLGACEDYELYLRIARGFPVYCHGETVAEYRRHEANTSHDFALMLSTSVAVLRSQREHLKGNRRHREAYKIGIRHWQSWYGELLASKVLAHMRKREWGQALRDALALVRYHPRILLRAYRKLGSRSPVRRRGLKPREPRPPQGER